MTFGFREPYQVLVDAEMVQDSCRFKMELAPALQRTVHGTVKPMITQCEIRKLYAQKNDAVGREAIEVAKSCERRRCGHHPDEYPEPLGTLECFQSVIDPKDSGENKHRYVVASQNQDLRRMLRAVRGVPLIYIKRSVMILEPMSDESAQLRAREERSKFRAGIKPTIGKRKRDERGHTAEDAATVADDEDGVGTLNGHNLSSAASARKKAKRPGPKGPNPLSVKKAKKKAEVSKQNKLSEEGPVKSKRRRTAKPADTQSANDTQGDGTALAEPNGDES